MAPWLLIGGAIVGVVALGVLVYTVYSAEEEKPHATRGGGYDKQYTGPLVEYSEIAKPSGNSRHRSRPCKVCERSANAIFKPCGHRIFCREHAEVYIDLGHKSNRRSRCPDPRCGEVIEYSEGKKHKLLTLK